MISDYDQRQLKRMGKQISNFQNGNVGLDLLIGDLEFLLNAMESMDLSWKRRCDSQISVLEEVYADTLDQGIKKLGLKRETLVKGAIGKLKSYILEKSFQDA